jgi:hypothetical protein
MTKQEYIDKEISLLLRDPQLGALHHMGRNYMTDCLIRNIFSEQKQQEMLEMHTRLMARQAARLLAFRHYDDPQDVL